MRTEGITREDHIDFFLAKAEAVAAGLWKDGRHTTAFARTASNFVRNADLARQGLFRAYLIRDGPRPVTTELGYPFGNTYHCADSGYVDIGAHLSAGSVLLLLIIRDLIETSPIRRVNAGMGDAD